MSVVNKLPKSENGYGVNYTTESGNRYVISHNKIKNKFTLWKNIDNRYEKIGVANNPIDLYKKCN